jgi:hypothetical protein
VRKICLLPLLLLLPSLAWAGTTTVTGTVTDSYGNSYANGSIAAALQVQSGVQPRVGTTPINPSSGPFPLDSTGSFSVMLTDNMTITPSGTQWVVTICGHSIPWPGTPGVASTKICFSSVPLVITGSTMNISTQLNAAALPLAGMSIKGPPGPSGPSGPTGPTGAGAGALPAGTTLANQFNAGSGVFGGATANTDPVTGNQFIPNDAHFGSGTPWFDVIAFCASGSQQSTTGTVSGSSLTLAAAIDFLVCPSQAPSGTPPGEGITIYHAGSPSSVAAPTNLTVGALGATGSTTHVYSVAANDFSGGASASASVTITNSNASLGSTLTATITNTVLTSNVATITAANSFSAGQWVTITGTANGVGVNTIAPFNNVWNVASATSSSFTFALPHANIPTATDTGTAVAINENNLCWTPSAGAASYSILRDGTYLVTTFDSTPPSITYCYHDNGATANNQGWGNSTTVKPDWLPSGWSGAAVNDWCQTTIASGAGTTSLGLAASCPAAVTSQIVKHDDTPAVQAAVNAADTVAGGRVLFPVSGNFNIGNIVWPDTVTVKRGWIILDLEGQLSLTYPLTFTTPVTTGYGQSKIRMTGGTGGSAKGSQFPSGNVGLINSGFTSPAIHIAYANATSLFPFVFDSIGIFNRGVGGGDGLVDEGGNSGGLYINNVDFAVTGTALKIGYGGIGGGSNGPCTGGGGFGAYVTHSTFTTYFGGNPLTNCDGWTVDVNLGLTYFDTITLIGQGIHTLGMGTTDWNKIYQEAGSTFGFLTWDTSGGAGACNPQCGSNSFRHVELSDSIGVGDTYFINTYNGAANQNGIDVNIESVEGFGQAIAGGPTPIADCSLNQNGPISKDTIPGNCNFSAGVVSGRLFATGGGHGTNMPPNMTSGSGLNNFYSWNLGPCAGCAAPLGLQGTVGWTAHMLDILDPSSTVSGQTINGFIDQAGDFSGNGYLRSVPIVVASLPAAATGNAGQIRTVSDSTTISAEGQTCTGGSTNSALAVSNGSVWKCF